MRVQAFCPKFAVKRFNEAVVGRLAGPGEVEHDALLVGPQIEIPADELRALVDPNGLRISMEEVQEKIAAAAIGQLVRSRLT